VLFTPRRALAYLCVSLIPFALAFRVAMQVLVHNDFGFALLPGSVDALACGALLAIAGPVIVTKRLAVLAGASVLAVLVCHFFQSLWILSVALPSFAILISGAANGFGGMFGRILSQPLLQYIGRISYGIYVIHFPITTLGANLSQWFPAIVPEYLGLGGLCYRHFGACDALLALHRKPNQPPPQRNSGRSL
jgi:peptidoglycan/LPS O-acetylase OafA/YrhL